MSTRNQANEVWCVLVAIAHTQGRTITYEELGDLTGLNHRKLGAPLEMVAQYCKRNGCPPLTALVVRKDTGVPSEESAQFGARTPAEIFRIQRRVYEFDWRTFKGAVPIERVA